MINIRIGILMLTFLMLVGCRHNKSTNYVEEDSLGFIDASVTSEETNLKQKADYISAQAGNSDKIYRSFENAPPLIPHTTQGFFPIKRENNICMSCHMPDKAETSGAVPLPETHFTNLRPKMVEVNGILTFKQDSIVSIHKLNEPSNAYFNCSQCHVPQTTVTVNINNLFTPEFREEFGLEKSDLRKRLNEGIKTD